METTSRSPASRTSTSSNVSLAPVACREQVGELAGGDLVDQAKAADPAAPCAAPDPATAAGGIPQKAS